MRAPSISRSFPRRQWDVPLTPMIDVVFLLLIFFVWTASFQILEYELPSYIVSNQASAGKTQPDPADPDFDAVVIRIGWERGRPQWSLNKRPLTSFALIQERLSKLASVKQELSVIIDPAAEVPLSHVIDAYDAGRSVGFSDIRFATHQL